MTFYLCLFFIRCEHFLSANGATYFSPGRKPWEKKIKTTSPERATLATNANCAGTKNCVPQLFTATAARSRQSQRERSLK